MPLNEPALALTPHARSVQAARRWVGSACQQLGRGDLRECAELGVSELVTNALLHGEHPISVRVRGTAEHPRVEVADGSSQPPVVPPSAGIGLDGLLSTFGRGLHIVAMCSVAWGAAIEIDGKFVWFEPAREPHQELAPDAEILRLDRAGDQPRDDVTTTVVELGRVPLKQVVEMRTHYNELRRELRLLSLAHQDDYPLAQNLTEVFARFEQSFPPTVASDINAALGRGAGVVDLRLGMYPDAAAVIEQMMDLLDLADEFCRAKRLLSLARSPQQRTFQQWYLGEFIRQSRGEPPRVWSPSTSGQSSSNHVS